jgi:hypothetical protein
MKRTLTAILVVAAAALVPSAAPAAAQARSCANVNAVVLSTGAVVSQVRASGTDCGTARNTARQWLAGLSRRDDFVECVPPLGEPSETCTIGRFSCRASAARGESTANTMRCHYGRRTLTWRADFNMQPDPSWDEL